MRPEHSGLAGNIENLLTLGDFRHSVTKRWHLYIYADVM